MQAPHTERPSFRNSRAISLGLAAIPFVCLVLCVVRYSVDIPYRDEWSLLEFLRKDYQGTLSLHDLWLPLNEHRMFFPRLILLRVIRLTHWNTSYEIALSILCAVGLFALIVYQTERTKASLGITGGYFLLPVLSLLVFSLKQYENWLMGFELAFFLNVLSVVAGVVALAMPHFRWWRFALALAFGVVASYSTANGLLYWLVALPLVFTLPCEHRCTKVLCLATWLLVALATITVYFHDYHATSGTTLTTFAGAHPGAYVLWVLCYLGNPAGPNHILATALVGLLGLLAFTGAAFLLLRSRHLTLQTLAPYLALALYSIGSALGTGAGRVFAGSLQAMISRYVTFAMLLWIAVFVLLYLLFLVNAVEHTAHTARSRWNKTLAGTSLFLFITLACAVGRSSAKSFPVFPDWQMKLGAARAELRSSGADLRVLKEVYPWDDPNLPARETPFLREHHLSVFREDHR